MGRQQQACVTPQGEDKGWPLVCVCGVCVCVCVCQLSQVGAYLMDQLKRLQSENTDLIGDVRGLGLMVSGP